MPELTHLLSPGDWQALGWVAVAIGLCVLGGAAIWREAYNSGFAEGHAGAQRYKTERDDAQKRLRRRLPPPARAPRRGPVGGPPMPMPRRKPRRTPPTLLTPIDGWGDIAPTVEHDVVRTRELPAVAPRLHAPASRPVLEEAAR